MSRHIARNHPPAVCDTADEQDAWYSAHADADDERAWHRVNEEER
jgi:hypothetical protein